MATGDPTVYSSYGNYINLQDLSSSAQAIGAGSGELGVIFLSASVLHLGQTGSAAGVTVAARNMSLPDHDGSAVGLSLGGVLVTATAAELNKLDNCTATTAELNYVDVTAGTAAASKALVLDASKNIATIGTVGCGAITSTGASSFAQGTFSGRIISDDATEATTTTDGSLQTDGGLSVAKSAVVGDDLDLLSDGCIVNFGASKDISLTHTADTGLTMAGAHANGTNLKLNNTAGDGDCRVELQLDGTTLWSMGVEDGDSDKFVIEDGAGALGADPAFEIAADKSAKFFGTLEATTSFTIGSAALTEAELEMLDGITAGTVAASKAVVVDGNKDAASFRNLTATGAVTAGSFVIGSADISEAELETIDGVTAGTVAASKAVVVDSNKDISSFRHLTAAGAVTAGTSFIIGSADLNETDMEKLDGITDGTGAANKALVLDGSRNVGNINMLTASYARIGELDVDLINTINKTETTLEILDKLIIVASGSNAANSDAAGLQFGSISGTDNVASLLYDNANSAIDFNIGGTTEVRLADGVFRPETDNDVDLGASGAEFKDLYIDGVAYVDTLNADALGANLDHANYNSTNVDIDSGAIDGTIIGAASAAAATVTTLSLTEMGANWTNASRTVADMGIVTTMDLNGGSIDGTTIGAASATTGVFTTLTANTSVLPDSSGGADLGSTSAEWGDLFIADDKKIQLGSGQDFTMEYDEDGDDVAQFAGANMRLGHGAATELQFRDSALKVYSSADGQLDLEADTELEITAPTLDVDASTAVAITSPSVVVDSGTSDKPVLEIKNTNADANPGTLKFNKDSASPADNDELGEIEFYGDDDGGTATMFAKMVVSSTDVSNGSEDGEIAFKIRAAGAIKEISMGGGAGLTLPNDSTYGVVKAHSLVTYSDETLKTNIQPLDSALEMVSKLQGVSYDWKSDGSSDVGFIAQDVQKVIPQVVYGNTEGDYALDYSKMTSILVEAMKEQQAQINDLKAQLDK